MAAIPPSSFGGVSIFADLAAEHLERVAERFHERLVPAGTEIITQEEPGDTVFLIREGSVKVCRRRAEGGEVILSVLGPGELVGEMSVADGLDRWASVETLEDSRVLWIDGDSFRSLLEEIPTVRSRLIELLCRRSARDARRVRRRGQGGVRPPLARATARRAEAGRRDADPGAAHPGGHRRDDRSLQGAREPDPGEVPQERVGHARWRPADERPGRRVARVPLPLRYRDRRRLGTRAIAVATRSVHSFTSARSNP
jgi:CRP-like cAMP-binding protein